MKTKTLILVLFLISFCSCSLQNMLGCAGLEDYKDLEAVFTTAAKKVAPVFEALGGDHGFFLCFPHDRIHSNITR